MDWRLIAAQHAAERSAALVHRKMARGLDGLATVAATAPFVGLLGTAFWIAGSFRGVSGSRFANMLAMISSLSESLVFTALALAIATLASVAHHHLRSRLAEFDVEMRHAARTLPNYFGVITRIEQQ